MGSGCKACEALTAMLLISGLVMADEPARPAAADATERTARVAYLDTCPGTVVVGESFGVSPNLFRELARQALLIAARDELGLATRDAWLGSEMPVAGNDAPLRVNLIHTAVVGHLDVAHGFGPQPTVVPMPVQLSSNLQADSLPKLIVDMEAASRTTLVEILKQLGFQAAPGRHAKQGRSQEAERDAAIAAANERRLKKLNIFSQFNALRQLHASLREDGESPQRMGQLVRGYAHLGMLTELQWHPAHKVFKARALLYAQRMVSKHPASAAGLDHRAYAEAWCGLHAAALQSLKEAAQLAAATPPKSGATPVVGRAAWVPVIAAFCRLDIEALDKLKQDEQLKPLAELLGYCAEEQSSWKSLIVERGTRVIQANPLCFRIHESLCQQADAKLGPTLAAESPHVLARVLPRLAAVMPDMPDSALEILSEMKSPAGAQPDDAGRDDSPIDWKRQAALIQTLLNQGRVPAAGAPVPAGVAKDSRAPAAEKPTAERPADEKPADDANELRWETLGLLLREMSWLQIMRRAHFERYVSNRPVEPWLAETEPVTALHPYHALMGTYAETDEARLAACREMLKISPEGLEPQAVQLGYALYACDQAIAKDFLTAAFNNQDETALELGHAFTAETELPRREKLARRLLAVSPHSPVAQAFLVEHNFDEFRQQAAEWEKSADKRPWVAYAFGQHYGAADDLPRADAVLRSAAKKTHDRNFYFWLADIYEKHGKEDGWLSALEASLLEPDEGLNHALVQVQIAYHFMRQGAWAKARPYAEQAAKSRAAWALCAAGLVNEELRDWPRAEPYFQAMSESYPDERARWYFFCKRTGQGRLDAARQIVLDHVQKMVQEPSPQPRVPAHVYLLERRDEEALKYFEMASQTGEPYYHMQVALLADERKQAERRDKALQDVLEAGRESKAEQSGRPATELVVLAEALIADVAKGGKADFDIPALEKLCTESDPEARAGFHYFLGRYLDDHGKTKAAIDGWKQCMSCTAIEDTYVRTLAAEALLRHGVKPADYANAYAKRKPTTAP